MATKAYDEQLKDDEIYAEVKDIFILGKMLIAST